MNQAVIKVGAGVVSLPVLLVLYRVSRMLLRQLYFAYLYRSSGCNVPAAKEIPLWGSRTNKEFHQERIDYAKELGPVFYSSFMDRPSINISDPELINIVMSKENFPKNRGYSFLAGLWGQNIVTMQHGENGPWKDHRHLVNPAFKLSSIRAIHYVFGENALAMAKKFDQYAKTKEVFDFQEDIVRLTLDVISSAGFSYDLGAFRNREQSTFFKSLHQQFDKIKSPFMLFGFVDLVNFLFRKEQNDIDKVFYRIIEDRIRERQERKEGSSNAPRDILDMLLEPGDNGRQLTREQIRNELFIFYVAGSETTSTTLSWTIYALTQNPDVEEKLVQEVESVMGPYKGGNLEAPTASQLEEMPYMTMVLNEALRLYPPVTGLSRENPETFEYKGYVFPKGIDIHCSFMLAHKNPEFWTNPEKFEPERFSKENSEGRPLGAFVPFSAGPRICLGKNFFYNEAKTILATIIRAYKFHLDPTKESGRMNSGATLKPNAVWVSVTRRDL